MIGTAIDRGMTVVLDRSLATALYDPGLARFGNSELGAKLVTIGSFSAGYGLAGWRVGWFSAPPETMKLFRELKQAMSICTTAVSQFAALAVLDGPADWVESRRAEFTRRRDEAMTRLSATPLVPIEPDAYPALLVDVRAVDADDRRFAARLREETGVVVDGWIDVRPGHGRLRSPRPECPGRDAHCRRRANGQLRRDRGSTA